MDVINGMSPNIFTYSKGLRRRIVFLAAVSTLIIVIFMYKKSPYILDYEYDLSIGAKSNCELYCAENDKIFEDKCHWYFLNYTPSAWESIWYDNIDTFLQNSCERLANVDNLNKTILFMERLIELQKFDWKNNNDKQNKNDELLSKMFYRQRCFDYHTNSFVDVTEASQLIEPLIGLLRDPFSICPRINSSIIPSYLYDDAIILSKRFVLPSVSAPYVVSSLKRKHRDRSSMNLKLNSLSPWMYKRSKVDSLVKLPELNSKNIILFDIGSSYFGEPNVDDRGTSSRWLYEYFRRFNVQFDRIIAYEVTPLDPKVLWEQVPDDAFPAYTIINTGCAENGKFNPWTTLKKLAKPSDHVVIKLDIDHFAIENSLINQLVNDPNIYSLIDEFFFEYHVTVKEMLPYWGSSPGTLKDSYILFTKLRQLGIRMHSWP